MHPPMLANPYLNVLCDVLQDQRHENVLLMTVNLLGSTANDQALHEPPSQSCLILSGLTRNGAT